MAKRINMFTGVILVCASLCAFSQTNNAQTQNPATNQAVAAAITSPNQSNSDAKAATGAKQSQSGKIPSGAKVYVAPMGGFENYVIAGIVKKKAAVVIVADRDKADYEIRGAAETEKAGWAKMLFLSSQNSNEQASVNVQEIKTGDVVFAYSVNKLNSVHGKQSAGEAIGKHLKEAIGKD